MERIDGTQGGLPELPPELEDRYHPTPVEVVPSTRPGVVGLEDVRARLPGSQWEPDWP